MSFNIISNRKNTSVVLHFTGTANSSVNITGNTLSSNIAVPGEEITGAYIAQAVWGCAPGAHISVRRGGNIVAVYDSSGQQDYAGCGIPINVFSTEANLQINFNGTTNAFLILELQKQGNLTANSEYFRG